MLTIRDDSYDDGKEKSRKPKTEQINKAKAFWTRSKNDLKKKEYIDFYKSFSNDTEDPFDFIHFKAEGNLEFTILFYLHKSLNHTSSFLPLLLFR